MSSYELAKLFGCESGVSDDTAHRERIDGVATRYRKNPITVRHDNMLAFSHDSESSFLERTNGTRMWDARYLGHLNCDLDLPNVRTLSLLRYD